MEERRFNSKIFSFSIEMYLKRHFFGYYLLLHEKAVKIARTRF